jgi:hypothetical protein
MCRVSPSELSTREHTSSSFEKRKLAEQLKSEWGGLFFCPEYYFKSNENSNFTSFVHGNKKKLTNINVAKLGSEILITTIFILSLNIAPKINLHIVLAHIC